LGASNDLVRLGPSARPLPRKRDLEKHRERSDELRGWGLRVEGDVGGILGSEKLAEGGSKPQFSQKNKGRPEKTKGREMGYWEESE